MSDHQVREWADFLEALRRELVAAAEHERAAETLRFGTLPSAREERLRVATSVHEARPCSPDLRNELEALAAHVQSRMLVPTSHREDLAFVLQKVTGLLKSLDRQDHHSSAELA